MLSYFSTLQKDSLIFYKDTTISIGFHLFFTRDLALSRAKIDSTKSQQEIYHESEQEYFQYNRERKKIIAPCNYNILLKNHSDLEINYWYNPKDKVYSIDIVKILKNRVIKKVMCF